jgi:hypothetical protein
MFGLTVNSIKQEGRIEDLFANHAAVVGAGVRVTDYWRINTGMLVFKSFTDATPDRRRRINASPLVAVSLDMDILGSLGKVGTVLFPLPK